MTITHTDIHQLTCVSAYTRGSSQSAPKYSLLLQKKLILTNPKLGPKKTVSVIVFRIAWTLDVKIVWFGRQVTVCVQKRFEQKLSKIVENCARLFCKRVFIDLSSC